MTAPRDIVPFSSTAAKQRRVGLLAGGGRFPIVFAQAAREAGISVDCMAVEGMYSEELIDCVDRFATASLGKVGKAIRHFRRRRITEIVMAGKIEKKVLFSPRRMLKFMPDWRTIHMLTTYAAANHKDDTLLLAVIREFERDGIRFSSALDFCPELLVKHGFLTRKKPTPKQWKDVRFGWELAKEIGRLDIGQTIVVNDMAVMAVEAIEGTDAAIRRGGELCRRGGFTVVKVAKPQQDMRFDVPTVGLQTIQTMYDAGGRVLAVESGQTILLDEPEVLSLANKLGICIVSLNVEEARLRIAS